MAASPLALTQQQYFALLVQTYQAGCFALGIPVTDTGPGSTLGMYYQAAAQAAFNEQAQVDVAYAYSRLASSSGADVDSYVAPFGYQRLPYNAATASLLFTAGSIPSAPIVIPVGAIVQRADGVQYIVVAGTQATYSTTLGGYVLSGALSLAASAVCLSPGSIGNTLKNTITAPYGGFGNPLPLAIVSVTNPDDVKDGKDAESDAALIARFQAENGIAKYATRVAIIAGITATQVGLTYQIGNRINPDGTPHPSYFCVIVNQSGNPSAPPQTLLDAVSANVDARIAAGVDRSVVGPTLAPVSVTAVVPGASSATLAAATSALAAFINTIGLDPTGNPTTLSYAAVAANLLANVGGLNVTQLKMNGVAGQDVTASFASQIVTGSITLTAS